jgi:hypothetical protein
MIRLTEEICQGLATAGLDDECWSWYEENKHILPEFFQFIVDFLAEDLLEADKVCQTLLLCPSIVVLPE